MAHSTRIRLVTSAAALALTAGFALAASPFAAAAGGPAPPSPMHIGASGGDNTVVDSDGTQGSFGNAMQGTIDTDGDQDAFDLQKSDEATPQEKAQNKMTK